MFHTTPPYRCQQNHLSPGAGWCEVIELTLSLTLDNGLIYLRRVLYQKAGKKATEIVDGLFTFDLHF